MGIRDEFSVRESIRASVYALTDRQLAEEYRELTGVSVQIPSSQSLVHWREWRNDLQLKVLEERVASPGS
jgi:hypothetical protein